MISCNAEKNQFIRDEIIPSSDFSERIMMCKVGGGVQWQPDIAWNKIS